MKKQFLLLLLACLSCAAAQAQWLPAPSPANYALYVTAFKGDTAVIATQEPSPKFYLSTDAGQVWTDISDPAFAKFYPVKINRGKVFAFEAFAGAAVYEGGKWQLRNKGLQTYQGSYYMWSLEGNDKRLVATSIKNTLNWLYLSDDEGLNWTPVSSTGLKAGYEGVYGNFVGDRIYSRGINGSKPEAYYSDDAGKTWKSLPVSGPNGQTNVLHFNENRSVVLVKGAGGYYLHQGDSLVLADGLPAQGYVSWVVSSGSRIILRRDQENWMSSDGGRHWSAAPQVPNFYTLERYGSQWVGITEQNQILASSDNGDTWVPFGNTNVTTSVLGGLYSTGDQLFCVTIGKEGFYRFDPAANDWEARNTGIQKSSAFFRQMLADGPKAFVYSWNGFFLSQDGGQTWQEQPLGLWNLRKIGTRYFAQDGYRLVTSENGTDWSPLPVQPTDVGNIFGRDGVLYAATYTGLLLASSNVGVSWDTVSTVLPTMPIHVAFDATQWYFSSDDGIYASSDAGQTWSKIGPFAQPYALLEHKGRLLTGLYGGGVRYTDDGGQNWKSGTTVSTVKFESDGNGLLAVGDVLLATGSGGQVRVSVNQGANWTSFNTGLTNSVNCTETVVYGNWLYSPCDNGLWRRPLSELPAVTAVVEPLDDLYSASPNPTTGLFFLKNVPSSTKLTVQVSDLNGQVVFSGDISGNGYALDLTAQPPGMYCVKSFDGEKWSVSRVVKQ